MSNTSEELRILEQIRLGIERELKRKADAVEARRLWYEKTGSDWLKKKVVVKFCKLEGGVSGQLRNQLEGFTIHLVPGNSLQVERSAFCHEVGHAMLNHGSGWTVEKQAKSEIMEEVLQSPELERALGADTKKIYQAAYLKQYSRKEEEADKIGKLLFRFYWPDDEYVPHNSTKLHIAKKFG
jgi:hypothetical protein